MIGIFCARRFGIAFVLLAACSCEEEGDPPGTPCAGGAHGDVRCTEDLGFERCNNGTWDPGVCPGFDCANGRCQSSRCAEGDVICGSDGVRTCDGEVGGWLVMECPDGQVCSGGVCMSRICTPNVRSCKGNQAFQCNQEGTRQDLIAQCMGSDVCMGGACIDACKLAADELSFVGCQYYALDTDNNTCDGQSANDQLQYDLVVGNPSETYAANVTVYEKISGSWAPVTTVAGAGIAAQAAGAELNMTINAGDVLQVSSAAPGGDLSGTFVEADSPVAVFAGAECTRIDGLPCDGWSESLAAGLPPNPEDVDGDHIEEQMMPLVTWGTNFVGAHLHHSDQTPTEQASSTWKIIAAVNDTVVTFEPAPGVTGTPMDLTLMEGQVYQFQTTGGDGHFFFRSTDSKKPLQAIQVVHGEMASILVPPVEQYLPEYVFLLPPFFKDTLAVVRPSGTPVFLDGVELLPPWQAAGSNFEVRLLNELTGEISDGPHVLNVGSGDPKGDVPGIQLLGLDLNCSYGYVGGLRAARIFCDVDGC